MGVCNGCLGGRHGLRRREGIAAFVVGGFSGLIAVGDGSWGTGFFYLVVFVMIVVFNGYVFGGDIGFGMRDEVT